MNGSRVTLSGRQIVVGFWLRQMLRRRSQRLDVAGEAPTDGFDEAGWHFVERAFAVDLVGDLGDHLRFAL